MRPFGNVLHGVVLKDINTYESRGFGFVHMDNPVSAASAKNALDGKPMDGRPMIVKLRSERREAGGPGSGPRPGFMLVRLPLALGVCTWQVCKPEDDASLRALLGPFTVQPPSAQRLASKPRVDSPSNVLVRILFASLCCSGVPACADSPAECRRLRRTTASCTWRTWGPTWTTTACARSSPPTARHVPAPADLSASCCCWVHIACTEQSISPAAMPAAAMGSNSSDTCEALLQAVKM